VAHPRPGPERHPRPDQRWSALDSRKLYAHAMTADRLYHAALRAELTRRLDVRWRPVDPTGVFVIDSKRYRGHLHYSAGRLWHGRRALDHTLDTLWWEATQVAETLGFGPHLHVYPVLCVHVARLPWLRELLVDGIPVLAAGTLRPALQVIRQALSPEQVELVAAQVRSGFQPAA
jgi:hypothetical protein